MFYNKFNIFIYIFLFTRVNSLTEEDEGVKYANRCEGNNNYP